MLLPQPRKTPPAIGRGDHGRYLLPIQPVPFVQGGGQCQALGHWRTPYVKRWISKSNRFMGVLSRPFASCQQVTTSQVQAVSAMVGAKIPRSWGLR